jgi:hypothetical protein
MSITYEAWIAPVAAQLQQRRHEIIAAISAEQPTLFGVALRNAVESHPDIVALREQIAAMRLDTPPEEP